jgi:hypothetical protein
MVAAFASDAIVIWSPNFRFSLYFSLLNAETGSHQTASSATQSGLCGLCTAVCQRGRQRNEQESLIARGARSGSAKVEMLDPKTKSSPERD